MHLRKLIEELKCVFDAYGDIKVAIPVEEHAEQREFITEVRSYRIVDEHWGEATNIDKKYKNAVLELYH